MSTKTQRNDPCPCGSGKKYKKCCLLDGVKFEPSKRLNNSTNKTLDFFKKNDSRKLANLLIEAQLNPENHGKNFRIEELAKILSINVNKEDNFNLKEFENLLSTQYPNNHMEDIPENLFCEQVVFYGGNYNLFAGISSFPVEIFKTFSDVIFNTQNNLPEKFKEIAYQGIRFILEIGQIYSNQIGVSGNIIGSRKVDKIVFRDKEYNFGISEIKLHEICKRAGISKTILSYFLIEQNDALLKYSDPDLSPLLFNPIIKIREDYFFLLISNQANCINEFILNLSMKFGCKTKLLELYHNRNWSDIGYSLHTTDWLLTDIQIPSKGLKESITEGIFQFDTNRLAYVCYIRHSDIFSVYEREKNKVISSQIFNNRLKEVIEHLKEYEGYKFITLILFSGLGRDLFLSIHKPLDLEERIAFSVYDFINLTNSERWEILNLYKFAKSLNKFTSTTFTPSSSLDMYSVYKAKDEQFYLSDDKKSDFFLVVPGDGSRLIEENKIFRNSHGALAPLNGKLVYIPVFRKEVYAPIYYPEKPLQHFFVMLNTFKFPLWLSNYQNKLDYVADKVASYSNAICFWLEKLKPAISDILNENIKNPLEFELYFDKEIFETFTTGEILKVDNDKTYKSIFLKNRIQLHIPINTLKTLVGNNNKGERLLVGAVLNSFNLIDGVDFDKEQIEKFLDKYVPLGQMKMILFSDSQNNIMTDNRWLSPMLYITEAEKNILSDDLPIIVEKNGYKIPKVVEGKDSKVKLFNLVVNTHLEKISEEINQFDNVKLLLFLTKIYEHLIWKREYNKIIIPAQVICFSDNEIKINEINKNQIKIASTSLTVRCLIEYISAKPSHGSLSVGYDDIDILLARMNQIINYGFLSDSVHLGMDNPTVGLLNSGRLGISKEFFEEKMSKFSDANISEEIDSYLENFSKQFDVAEDYEEFDDKIENKIKEEEKELKEIDKAFKIDWGIGYLNIYKFCHLSAKICFDNEVSVIKMTEKKYKKLLLEYNEIPEDEIVSAIDKFSLFERESYLKAPESFKNTEVFPWKYNREFSFTRRFLIRYKENDKNYVMWGFRNAIAVQKQFEFLLFNGKLNNGGKNIDNILGKFRERKGKIFRDEVKNWLKTFTKLTVLDYEVVISNKGHLKSETSLGDIDILAFEKKSKTLLSLECKDTDKAKNIHEMKSELDNYLGRTEGKGMIEKHVKRHNWLIVNKDKIKTLLNIDEIINIRSFMITSEIIPTAYIKSKELPIPIVSFTEMKKHGIKILFD